MSRVDQTNLEIQVHPRLSEVGELRLMIQIQVLKFI